MYLDLARSRYQKFEMVGYLLLDGKHQKQLIQTANDKKNQEQNYPFCD
jgi:hypothetical protein